MIASPWPPPEQMAATPRPPPRRRSSCTSVPSTRAPEAPIGWPRAIAPPFTFTFDSSRPSMRIELMATDANASLNSNRSMSSTVRPAFSSAAFVAFAGVRARYGKSSATAAWATTVASTARPFDFAHSSLETTNAPAPSFTPGELPAVCVPSLPTSPGSLASDSSELSRRGASSISTTVSPFFDLIVTGTISSGRRPLSVASTASSWLRSAHLSRSARVISSSSPTSVASTNICLPVNGFVRPSCTIASSIFASPMRYPKRPCGSRYGAPDIDSMPPAAIGPERSPARTYWSARPTARKLDAQTLFTVSEGTSFGIPPLICAWREGTWPCPACSTWPKTTCSTCSGATSARSSAPRIAVPPSSIASTGARAPPILPKGVRAVPRMTVLGMRARIVRGRGRPRPARLTSTQVAHRHHDAPERLVRDARKRCVPGHGCCSDAEPAACLDDRLGAIRLADAEDDERRRQQQEDEVDRHRDTERRDPHVRREDAPGDQVKPDGFAQVRRRDLARVELLQHEERDPERAVGRECRRSERVVVAELPHAGKQLRETAVRKRQSENDRDSLVADKARVEEAQDKSRERKRGEAQGRRISDGRGHRWHDSPWFRSDTLSVRRVTNAGCGFHELPPFGGRDTQNPPLHSPSFGDRGHNRYRGREGRHADRSGFRERIPGWPASGPR